MELPGRRAPTLRRAATCSLDVTYDDGSYQEYADGYFGADVVIVTGALVDVES